MAAGWLSLALRGRVSHGETQTPSAKRLRFHIFHPLYPDRKDGCHGILLNGDYGRGCFWKLTSFPRKHHTEYFSLKDLIFIFIPFYNYCFPIAKMKVKSIKIIIVVIIICNIQLCSIMGTLLYELWLIIQVFLERRQSRREGSKTAL